MAIVRQATEQDVEAIHKIGQSVPEFSVNNDTINFWPQPVVQDVIRSNEAILLIAEENTKIQGFIIANCNKTFKKVIIENVYVLPGVRNSGIGEKLLSHLLHQVEKNGYEYIATLIPPEARAASNLYDNLGFTKGETFQWLDKSLANSFTKTK